MRRALLIFMVLSVASLGLAPSALATAEVINWKVDYPIATTLGDPSQTPCFPAEFVLIEGTLHTWGHYTGDPAGGYHNVSLSTLDVKAVGEISGATYRVSEPQLFVLQQHSDGFPFVMTYQYNTRVTGPGGSFGAHMVYHLTINADGQVTVEQLDTRIDCL
jgi:hypothetical protein